MEEANIIYILNQGILSLEIDMKNKYTLIVYNKNVHSNTEKKKDVLWICMRAWCDVLTKFVYKKNLKGAPVFIPCEESIKYKPSNV